MTVDDLIAPHLFDELQRAVTLALVGWLALAVLAVVLVALDARRVRRVRRRARFRTRQDIPRTILPSSSQNREGGPSPHA